MLRPFSGHCTARMLERYTEVDVCAHVRVDTDIRDPVGAIGTRRDELVARRIFNVNAFDRYALPSMTSDLTPDRVNPAGDGAG